jgi:hypothetical protein
MLLTGSPEARISAGASTVLRDKEFASSLQRFCYEVPNAYIREPRLIRAIGDTGCLFTVAAIVAKQDGGVTLADVQRVVCAELASYRRVRAIAAELERTGAIVRLPVSDDARRRQIVISGWLPSALALWGDAYAKSAHPWLSTMVTGAFPARTGWAARLLAGWVSAYERYGFLLARDNPVVLMFTNHFAGYPLLLEIIRSAVPLPDGTVIASVSRKAASRSFGLSRAHFAALLARCERLGWMWREKSSARVVLTEPVYRELQRWVAREIAWVVDLMRTPIT